MGGGGGVKIKNLILCFLLVLCYSGVGENQKSSLSYNSIIKARPHDWISCGGGGGGV